MVPGAARIFPSAVLSESNETFGGQIGFCLCIILVEQKENIRIVVDQIRILVIGQFGFAQPVLPANSGRWNQMVGQVHARPVRVMGRDDSWPVLETRIQILDAIPEGNPFETWNMSANKHCHNDQIAAEQCQVQLRVHSRQSGRTVQIDKVTGRRCPFRWGQG